MLFLRIGTSIEFIRSDKMCCSDRLRLKCVKQGDKITENPFVIKRRMSSYPTEVVGFGRQVAFKISTFEMECKGESN